jgi:hypothetical protein
VLGPSRHLVTLSERQSFIPSSTEAGFDRYTFNVRGFAVNGTYEVDGDVFTFLTDELDPQPDSGTYRWTYEDGDLKFNVIEDAHRLRYAFITYPFVLTE